MKKILALVLAMAMVTMMFAACKKEENQSSAGPSGSAADPGKSSSTAGGDGKYDAYNLACVYSEITGDFWGIVYNGCMAALDELKAEYGVEGYCVAPASSNDYTGQMDLLEAAVQKKVDGIVLCPCNTDTIGTFVTDNFKDDSTPIIVIDRSLNTTSPAVVAQCLADTYAMGTEQGKLAVEAMGAKGNYVNLGMSPENQSWADRSYGAIDYIRENAPEMVHIPGEAPYWTDQNTEAQVLQYIADQITANPGPLAFITTAENKTNQVVACISEISAERAKEIVVIGFDFSKTGYELIVNGAMYGAVGQNPYMMGYNSAYLICDYLAGAEVPEVAYVPYCVITKENLNSEAVKDYLASMKIEL